MPNWFYAHHPDDLIDFPVSSTWLAYYEERGLAPRRLTTEAKQPNGTSPTVPIAPVQPLPPPEPPYNTNFPTEAHARLAWGLLQFTKHGIKEDTRYDPFPEDKKPQSRTPTLRPSTPSGTMEV